jgi:hypothetical protein
MRPLAEHVTTHADDGAATVAHAEQATGGTQRVAAVCAIQGTLERTAGRVALPGEVINRLDFVGGTMARDVHFNHAHDGMQPHVRDRHFSLSDPSRWSFDSERTPGVGEYLSPVLSDPRIQGGVFRDAQ